MFGVCVYMCVWDAGADLGGSLGSDEPPSETKKCFEAILVGRGLNLVR